MPDSRLRRQAVPAYFHPEDSAAEWAQLASTDVGLVVANIADGPGLVREERWATAFAGVRAAGCDVVGYVDTGYLGLTGLRTQRGSTQLGDWLEQILREVETWYRLYGDQVTGIFLDQIAESDDGASLAPVFRRLRDDIHRLDADAVTVLNPGVAVPAAFADIADIIVTFEGSCEDYLAVGPDAEFEPLSWEPGREQMIWHMIHHTPDPAHAAAVIALSRQRGADLVFVTDGGGDNPYAALPSSTMWPPTTIGGDRGDVVRLTAGRRGRRRRSGRRTAPSSRNAPVRPMPDTALVTSPMLARRVHVVEASAEFLVTSSSRRVFLATGRPGVARWWTGSQPQIAADWLIENDRLYAYAGTGTDWVWTPSGQTMFEVSDNTARWTVDADRVGLDGVDWGIDPQAVFHVSAPGLREYSTVTEGCTTPTGRSAH